MITSRALYTHTPVEGERGVCAAGHRLAAQAGVRVMQEGGNAIDALCAAAFTAFVVEPASCGIGGYGHISLWLAERRRFVSIDAYCRAPLAARDDMFEPAPGSPTYYGHPFTEGDRAATGSLAPAVPGAVAGFCEAQAHYGRLTLEQVLAPAIEAADAGVPFTYSDRLGVMDRVPGAELGEATRSVLMPGGRFPRGGGESQPDRFDTRALARTLRLIARKGPSGFYRGRVAARHRTPRARRRGGFSAGMISPPTGPAPCTSRHCAYRGHEYVSCYDQVAYEALNVLERFDLARYGPDSYQYRHLVAEALALAFTDSMTPLRRSGFRRESGARAVEPRLRRRTREAHPDATRPAAAGGVRRSLALRIRGIPMPSACQAPEPPSPVPARARVASADRHGNLASCCISISSSFGSLVYVPEVGCFLNNAMQNFDPRPGTAQLDRPGQDADLRRPRAGRDPPGAGRLCGERFRGIPDRDRGAAHVHEPRGSPNAIAGGGGPPARALPGRRDRHRPSSTGVGAAAPARRGPRSRRAAGGAGGVAPTLGSARSPGTRAASASRAERDRAGKRPSRRTERAERDSANQ